MPKKVQAFACEYGCGRRVTTKRSAIVNHEKTCACNPDRRACKICKHKRVVDLPGDLPNSVASEPLCAIGKLPYGVLMQFDCESWEPSE